MEKQIFIKIEKYLLQTAPTVNVKSKRKIQK